MRLSLRPRFASPIIAAAIVAAALSFGTTTAAAAPAIGQPAPDFTAVDSRGKSHRLSDLRGKTVVLEWTNHDCPYVMKHYRAGNMQALQSEAAAAGTVWLQVISSAPGEQGHVDGAQADRIVAERKASPAATLLDPEGEVGRLYGARTTPHMYVVDKAGTLVYMGGIDDRATADIDDIRMAKNYVRAALAEVAAGKPVTDAVTRPYGCSVKY